MISMILYILFFKPIKAAIHQGGFQSINQSSVAVNLETALPADLKDRLKNSDFKRDLNECFSFLDVLVSWNWEGNFVVTKGESVKERFNGSVSARKMCLHGSEKAVLEESDN